MVGRFSAVVALITGGLGARCKRSAEPERDVEELLPCLAIIRMELATIEDVVEMLKVLWPSPPVPTMSHCTMLARSFGIGIKISYESAMVIAFRPRFRQDCRTQGFAVYLRSSISHVVGGS